MEMIVRCHKTGPNAHRAWQSCAEVCEPSGIASPCSCNHEATQHSTCSEISHAVVMHPSPTIGDMRGTCPSRLCAWRLRVVGDSCNPNRYESSVKGISANGEEVLIHTEYGCTRVKVGALCCRVAGPGRCEPAPRRLSSTDATSTSKVQIVSETHKQSNQVVLRNAELAVATD